MEVEIKQLNEIVVVQLEAKENINGGWIVEVIEVRGKLEEGR